MPYVVVLGAVTAFFLVVAPGLLGGEVMRPFDILYEYAPYAQHRPPGWEGPRNGTISDEAFQDVELDHLVREALRNGRLPAWNPYAAAGTPLMANGLSAPFELPRLASLAVPAQQAPAVILYLRMLVGALGMVALLGVGLRLGPSGSVIGALAFAFCAPFVALLGLPHGAAAAWLPLVVLGAIVAARRADGRGALALAFPLAGLVLAGHPETGFAVAALAAAAGLWTSRRPGAIAALAGGFVLGLALTAPYLVPHVLFTRSSHQGVARANVGAAFFDLSRWRVWVARPASLVSPAAVTSAPVLPAWRRLGLDTFPEANLAFGATAVVLAWTALRARWSDRRVRAALVVALAAFAITLRLPVVEGLLGLPLVRILNPNQFVQPFAAAMAILVAIGADAVVTGDRRARRVLSRVAVVLGAGLVVTWTVIVAAWAPIVHRASHFADLSRSYSSDPIGALIRARRSFAPRMAVQAVVYVLLAVIAVRSWRRWLALGLVAGVVVEAMALWFTYNPSVPASQAPPAVPELAVAQRLAGHDRVAGMGLHDLEPNTATLYGLRDVNVYDNVSEQTARFQRLIGFSQPAAQHVDARAGVAPAALDLLSVKVLLVGPGSQPLPGWPLAHDGPVRLYVNQRAVPRAHLVGSAVVERSATAALRRVGDTLFQPDRQVVVDRPPSPSPSGGGGTARIVADEPERVQVRTSAPGPRVLVLADTAAPGWQASVDGHRVPLLTADARVRAVALPGGRHIVTMTYRPPGLTLGLVIWGGAIVVCLGLAVPRRFGLGGGS